jgi:membrane protease YdiL (CAAX protease family)
VLIPGYYLNILFYGNSDYYAGVMFQPVSRTLTWILLIAFPVSIAFAELATYFGYIMPRLKTSLKPRLLSVLIPALFLSLQHCTLPLVPELNFILYRGLVYLPFAVVIGISVYKRPSLLFYFAVFHGLLDAMTVIMLLNSTSSTQP